MTSIFLATHFVGYDRTYIRLVMRNYGKEANYPWYSPFEIKRLDIIRFI